MTPIAAANRAHSLTPSRTNREMHANALFTAVQITQSIVSGSCEKAKNTVWRDKANGRTRLKCGRGFEMIRLGIKYNYV